MVETDPGNCETCVVQLRQGRADGQTLVSRSEAKALLAEATKCRIFVMDFSGIEWIGQAFADEIFRVFSNAHPDIELIAMHATPEVHQMIRRAEVLRDEQGGQLLLLK